MTVIFEKNSFVNAKLSPKEAKIIIEIEAKTSSLTKVELM